MVSRLDVTGAGARPGLLPSLADMGLPLFPPYSREELRVFGILDSGGDGGEADREDAGPGLLVS